MESSSYSGESTRSFFIDPTDNELEVNGVKTTSPTGIQTIEINGGKEVFFQIDPRAKCNVTKASEVDLNITDKSCKPHRF